MDLNAETAVTIIIESIILQNLIMAFFKYWRKNIFIYHSIALAIVLMKMDLTIFSTQI